MKHPNTWENVSYKVYDNSFKGEGGPGPGGLAPLRGQPALPLSLVGDGGAPHQGED